MKATVVLYSGNIYTMDSAMPLANAIALAGNRILAVGDNTEMRALLGANGDAIDLHRQTVVPGFTDSHLHFMSYGLSLKRVDLVEVHTLDEALTRVEVGVAQTAPSH